MKCPNCGADNISSARFCRHCGEKFLHGQSQFTQTDRTKRNKTTLLVTGIAVLAIVAVAGYFFGRGDKKIEEKSATDNMVSTYKQQVPSGNDMVEKDGSYSDNRVADRVASFRATAVSINPAAMTCADDSTLNISATGPGANICSDTSSMDAVYPTLGSGVCDENDYEVMVTDATPDDGRYNYKIACYVAGKKISVICTQNGCASPTGDDLIEKNSSPNEKRLASFKAISGTSAAARAISCDDAGGTLQSGISGDAMCDKGYPNADWPTVGANICTAGAADGNHYIVKDEVAGDGIFQYQVTCSIAGRTYTTTCSDTECSTN